MPAKKESDKSIPRNNRTLAVKKQIVRAFKKKAIKEKFDKRKLSKKNIKTSLMMSMDNKTAPVLNRSSFEYLWELLNPPLEFHNMRAKCESKLWNACTIHMQHRIYRLIRDRKRAGKPVEPNPWYAIVNARDAEPTNYNGSTAIDDVAKTTKMVVAWYKGLAGIYTLEEALALKLQIIREFTLNVD